MSDNHSLDPIALRNRIAELVATLIKVDRAAYQTGFKAGQKAQADRIAELEAALRFYADPFKYTDIHGDDVQVPDFYSETDFGETARAVLTGSAK